MDRDNLLTIPSSFLQLAQDASVEARMIAATVFSTLNESWDKFKTENGL